MAAPLPEGEKETQRSSRLRRAHLHQYSFRIFVFDGIRSGQHCDGWYCRYRKEKIYGYQQSHFGLQRTANSTKRGWHKSRGNLSNKHQLLLFFRTLFQAYTILYQQNFAFQFKNHKYNSNLSKNYWSVNVIFVDFFVHIVLKQCRNCKDLHI